MCSASAVEWREGLYYGIIVAAGALDTNGGPLIDEKERDGECKCVMHRSQF